SLTLPARRVDIIRTGSQRGQNRGPRLRFGLVGVPNCRTKARGLHPFSGEHLSQENVMHTATRANILLPIERLEAALGAPYLGQERAWVQGVADALTEMEHALLHHAADAASPDGVFAEV